MPDSSGIENGLIAVLAGDSTLAALLPDGVYFGEAPDGYTRFVVVELADEIDEQMFQGRAFEDALFSVKAIALSTAGADMKSAAARVDTVLDGATLLASGYSTMTVHRERRIRYTEVDEADPSIRWFHRGGLYRVVMSL